jgi:hypothetical protein
LALAKKPPAGYSKRPLPVKLGLKTGMKVAILHAPDDYGEWLQPLPTGVAVSSRLGGKKDFIQAFFDSKKALQRRMPALKKGLAKDGMLWVSWPKKASGVVTDLNGNVVRNMGLDTGLVDIKVCAVTDVWSGLKFVYRKADRG